MGNWILAFDAQNKSSPWRNWLAQKVYACIQENNIRVNCPIKCEPLIRKWDISVFEQAYMLSLSDYKIKLYYILQS
jgi:hypothetical protein